MVRTAQGIMGCPPSDPAFWQGPEQCQRDHRLDLLLLAQLSVALSCILALPVPARRAQFWCVYSASAVCVFEVDCIF